MLKKRGDMGHSRLVSYLRGKASNLSPLSMMLAVDFLQMFSNKLRKIPSIHGFLTVFIKNEC